MDADPSIVTKTLKGVFIPFRLGPLRSSKRSRTPAGADVSHRTMIATSSSADEHRRRQLVCPLQDTTAVTKCTVDLLLKARVHVRFDGLVKRAL